MCGFGFMMIVWAMGAEESVRALRGRVAGADFLGMDCKCGREKFWDAEERLDDVLRLRGRVDVLVDVVCRVACMGAASTG